MEAFSSEYYSMLPPSGQSLSKHLGRFDQPRILQISIFTCLKTKAVFSLLRVGRARAGRGSNVNLGKLNSLSLRKEKPGDKNTTVS